MATRLAVELPTCLVFDGRLTTPTRFAGLPILKANDKERAKDSLGTAYCWWMKYASLMDSMYFGMTMARSSPLPDWHAHDKSVLKEYSDLGGKGTPTCKEKTSQ